VRTIRLLGRLLGNTGARAGRRGGIRDGLRAFRQETRAFFHRDEDRRGRRPYPLKTMLNTLAARGGCLQIIPRLSAFFFPHLANIAERPAPYPPHSHARA